MVINILKQLKLWKNKMRLNSLFKINLKTICFNLRTFPFWVAIKLPVLIERHTIVKHTYMGGVQINSTIQTGMLQIGYIDFSNAMSSTRDISVVNIHKGGVIELNGCCSFSAGSCLNIESTGHLILNDGCSFNARTNIECHKKIYFGKNSLISWDCQFLDTDFHYIYSNGKKQNNLEEITIGDNCWICCNVICLKGSKIPNNCVIGSYSLVNRIFEKQNSLYAGNPARLKKENIDWDII